MTNQFAQPKCTEKNPLMPGLLPTNDKVSCIPDLSCMLDSPGVNPRNFPKNPIKRNG